MSTDLAGEAVSPARVRDYYRGVFKHLPRPGADGWVTVHSPFREDRTASFGLNLEHGGWRDHGTGESGDIFSFEMKHAGCDFATAKARILADPIPENRTRATIEGLARIKRLPADFLRDEMGLRDTPAGVQIPYCLTDGSPAPRQRIRSFLEHVKDPPWCWWSGAGEICPYGLEMLSLAQGSYLIIPEGESDRWTLCYHGFTALAIPGADMVGVLRPEHLAGFSRVFIVQESDRAGTHFVERMFDRLREIGYAGEVRIISLAPMKDVNQLHCKSSERFQSTFQAAVDAAVKAEEWTAPDLPAGKNVWAGIEDMSTFLSGEEDDVQFLDPEKQFVARGCVTEIFAPRGLGKTFFALWMAVRLAARGLRVLYLDRDNSRFILKGRLRGFGAAFDTPNLKAMSRDKCPPLTDTAAWAKFPYADFDVVFVDSLDSITEGVGEQDSGKPSRALAPLLNVARRENGPAVIVLGNVVRSGLHSRGSGVVEDRGDIVYEVRDATDFHYSGGPKAWVEELPPAGADFWASRASRRKQRGKYRLAFVPSKFRVEREPEAFVMEIDTTTDPWSVHDVTDEVDREGAEARQRKAAEKAQTTQKAVEALTAEIQRRSEAKEPSILKKEAEDFLLHHAGLKVTQREAREIINSEAFQIVEGQGKGRPKTVHLAYNKESSDRNTGVAESAKTAGENSADFGCPDSMHPTEIDPSQTRQKCGSEKPLISVKDSLFNPTEANKEPVEDEEKL